MLCSKVHRHCSEGVLAPLQFFHVSSPTDWATTACVLKNIEIFYLWNICLSNVLVFLHKQFLLKQFFFNKLPLLPPIFTTFHFILSFQRLMYMQIFATRWRSQPLWHQFSRPIACFTWRVLVKLSAPWTAALAFLSLTDALHKVPLFFFVCFFFKYKWAWTFWLSLSVQWKTSLLSTVGKYLINVARR